MTQHDFILIHINRELRRAKMKSSGSKRKVILEIFFGSGSISKALRKKGWGVVSIDIIHGMHHDLTRGVVISIINGWITSGVVCAIWFGTL